ncbi:hypothetical protein ACFSTC_26645 [Nonomuraea ferruginea]
MLAFGYGPRRLAELGALGGAGASAVGLARPPDRAAPGPQRAARRRRDDRGPVHRPRAGPRLAGHRDHRRDRPGGLRAGAGRGGVRRRPGAGVRRRPPPLGDHRPATPGRRPRLPRAPARSAGRSPSSR